MAESKVLPGASGSVPTVPELFVHFLEISLTGFGGVMPWAQRMLVERRCWLTPEQFAEDVALAQFLPGPNILNLSVVVGSRFRGTLGAVAAAVGLTIAPMMLMMLCGVLYARYGDVAWLRGPLAGLSSAAAGLVIAMTLKLAAPMFRARHIPAIGFTLVSFLAVALLRLPLWWVLLAVGPLSIGLSWWRRR